MIQGTTRKVVSRVKGNKYSFLWIAMARSYEWAV